MAQDLIDDKSNIGSGNGLVPSGNKPLPEPMLTQICHPMASLGHNGWKGVLSMEMISITETYVID